MEEENSGGRGTGYKEKRRKHIQNHVDSEHWVARRLAAANGNIPLVEREKFVEFLLISKLPNF